MCDSPENVSTLDIKGSSDIHHVPICFLGVCIYDITIIISSIHPLPRVFVIISFVGIQVRAVIYPSNES